MDRITFIFFRVSNSNSEKFAKFEFEFHILWMKLDTVFYSALIFIVKVIPKNEIALLPTEPKNGA